MKAAALLLAGITAAPLSAVTIGLPNLSTDNYGFTAHKGKQVVFEEFSCDGVFSGVSWFGLFSEGLTGIDTSSATFDVLFYAAPQLDTPITTDGGHQVDRVPGELLYSFSGEASGVATGQADPLQGGDIRLWSLAFSPLLLSGDYFLAICADALVPDYFLWSAAPNSGDGTAVYGQIGDDNQVATYDEEGTIFRDLVVGDAAGDQRAFALTKVPDAPTPWLGAAILLPLVVGLLRRRGAVAS